MDESGPDDLGGDALDREALLARWRSLPRTDRAALGEDVDAVVDPSLFGAGSIGFGAPQGMMDGAVGDDARGGGCVSAPVEVMWWKADSSG